MTTGEEISRSTASKKILILLHAGFLLVGIITVLLGQILPVISRKFALSDTEAGYLFVAQFSSSLVGAFFYNRIIKNFGYRKLLVSSFALMAIGSAALNFDSEFLATAAIAIYGGGIGLTIPAINLLIVDLTREKSSSSLNTVNFFWGFGAILSKPFVDFVGSPNSFFLPTILLSFALLLLSAAFLLSKFAENIHLDEKLSSLRIPIWTTRTAWLIAIFNFVHVGVESSVGGWITTYQTRTVADDAGKWISAATVFFLFLVCGRATAPLVFRFIRDNAVLLGSLILMILGINLILWTESFSFLIGGAAILGFGTSAVFPTNMSRFTKVFGARATENAAPLFVLGSLGGAFTTWLVGFVSTVYDNLRIGFSVVLASCLLLIFLQIILATAPPKPNFSAEISRG